MSEQNAPPEDVAEATTACLEYVRRATGVGLDFSPDTLGVLDHYVLTARKDLAAKPELAALVTRAVGAYFGEVVRARVPSFWRVPTANVHDWQLCTSSVFFWFNPVGVAYDALYGTNEHEGVRSILRPAAEDREFLERRLEAMPPLPEDEFYLLSTRFEVIEVCVETLRARLEERGYGESEFGEDEYAEEFRLS